MKLTLRSYLIYFLIWAIWLLIGTVFYTYYGNFGWSMGLYYAVNVGYSIGWSDSIYMVEDENSKIFSIFYLTSGVIFLAVIVVYIAGIFLTSRDKWYTSYLKTSVALRNELTTWEYIEWWYNHHQFTIHITLLLIAFIIFGVTFSCIYIKWDVVNGVYFTLATLSTGGLNSIPDGSPEWIYGIIGIYAAIGIIIQMIVVFYLASAYLQTYHHNRAEKAINEKISEEELRALREMGLEDEATVIDRHEFLLLMVVRLGLIDTEMITHINQKFDELDTMRMHKISIATLLGTSEEDIFDISLASVTNERTALTSNSSRQSVRQAAARSSDRYR